MTRYDMTYYYYCEHDEAHKCKYSVITPITGRMIKCCKCQGVPREKMCDWCTEWSVEELGELLTKAVEEAEDMMGIKRKSTTEKILRKL